MASTNDLIAGLALDSAGRVKLSDNLLEAFDDLPTLMTAGANNSADCSNTENGGCSNTGNCEQSINQECSNSTNCIAASNGGCPASIYDPGPGGF